MRYPLDVIAVTRDGEDAGQCSATEPVGLVFDVRRFAVHDGPGVRTTVFLKGCPLACSWCHNPESQQARPEIFLWKERCVGCGACVAACPTGAARVVDRVATTDRTACVGCGRCVSACPQHARARIGELRTVADILAEVERDVLFYDQSGGGLTLSGGEPLAQPEFALALLREAKGHRLATALDTCGHAPPEVMEAASRCVDLFLYDLKLLDRGRHAAATGVDNDTILANARRLDALGARIWIRFPLVPGINGRADDVAAVGRFVRGLRSVEAIQVLPYHRTGEAKRGRLERRCEIGGVEAPTAEETERAVETLRREARRPVTVGG